MVWELLGGRGGYWSACCSVGGMGEQGNTAIDDRQSDELYSLKILRPDVIF